VCEKKDLVVSIKYCTFGSMIKAVLTFSAFVLVVASILVNLYGKAAAARRYQLVGGILYVATFLLFIANSLTIDE